MTRQKLWLGISGGLVLLGACTGGAVKGYEAWQEAKRESFITQAKAGLVKGEDGFIISNSFGSKPKNATGRAAQEEDSAELRDLVTRAELGDRTPAFNQELLRIAAAERIKWSAAPTSLTGTRKWTNLGPGSERSSWNGTYYKAIDSGRPTQIRADLAGNVFLATSGGGVWSTSTLTSLPNWTPLTDMLGALAVGGMDLTDFDPSGAAQTMWLGLGDAFDQANGSVVKMTNGPSGWTPGATLALSGPASAASTIRDLRVDPTNHDIVLVATNDGFYRSTNASSANPTFTFVPLPTPGVAVATWSIAYVGFQGGQSQWLVSGVYGCSATAAPVRGFGTANCGTSTSPLPGNLGDVWKSTDSGATWKSVRASGGLPASVTGDPTKDIGRIALGAGATNNPSSTVLYAECGSTDEGNGFTAAILKSVNGGSTWTQVAVGTSTVGTGTPIVNTGPGSDCPDTNVGNGQSWYNLTIAVDPLDSNHVITGGNLCGIRTMNGGSTWEAVAHWLPSGGGGFTTTGVLPYVHADWHASLILNIGGRSLSLIGSDGGLFLSNNLFTATEGSLVTWLFPDIGLITHLAYGHGSGDPVYGNEDILFTGLQDNGTRFRLLTDENFIYDLYTKNWDQLIGGDGIGATVAHDPNGQKTVLYASVEFNRLFCNPGAHDCSRATRLENGTEIPNWVTATNPNLAPAPQDGEPFFMRYSPTYDASASVVTASSANLWKLTADNLDGYTYSLLTPNGFAGRIVRGNGPYASPFTYSVNGAPAHIYGVPLTGGRSALVVDQASGPTTIMTASNIHVGASTLSSTSSIAIPADPTHVGGTDPTKTWFVSVVAPSTNQGGPVTPDLGHVFKTVDGGATWIPFHGNGTGFDLPNVPTFVIRFDPSDFTDQTIYAATEIGLYRSTDGGNTWARYGLGLPMVRVYDLTISANGGLVRLSTYGRGIWEIRPHGEATAVAGNGDWDHNGVVDFFDLAPLAARLGTTPTSGATPRLGAASNDYDSTLDVSPPISALDESDLSALVAKFGGTP